MDHPLVLYDGVCRFCNGAVNFLVDRDPGKRLRFASLQSAFGQAILREQGLSASDLETMILIDGGRAYFRSTAALRAVGKLAGPWRAATVLLVVPAFLRDAVYRIVARNRYRWFGKLDQCRVPTPELRERFLD